MVRKQQRQRLIEPPDLPQEFATESLPDGQLYELDSYTNLILSNYKLSGARCITFNQVHLHNVEMCDTQFTRLELNNVRLDSCNLANAEWDRATLRRVELIKCRITGLKILSSHLGDTLIKDCQGKFAQFESTNFKAARFENCILSDANFQDADLSNVVFANCDLSNAMLSGAKLAGTDFRNSKIEGLDVKLEELRGAILDPFQAAATLQRYAGIIVKSIEDN